MQLNKNSLIIQFYIKILITLISLILLFSLILGGFVILYENKEIQKNLEQEFQELVYFGINDIPQLMQSEEQKKNIINMLNIHNIHIVISTISDGIIFKSPYFNALNKPTLPLSFYVYNEVKKNAGKTYTITLYKDKSEKHAALLIFTEVAFISFILMIILSLPIIWYLGKNLTRPIISLSNKINKMGTHNLNAPIEYTGPMGDELYTLVTEINALNQRLYQAFNSLNAFSSFVSHELKTPLTIMRANTYNVVPQTLSDLFESNINTMIELIDRFKLICLLQDDRYPFELAHISMKFLLESTQKLYKIENTRFKIQIDSPGKIQTDVQLAQVLIRNVLENSLKYSQQDKDIEINISGTTCIFKHTASTADLKSFRHYKDIADTQSSPPHEHTGLYLKKLIAKVLNINWDTQISDTYIIQKFTFNDLK